MQTYATKKTLLYPLLLTTLFTFTSPSFAEKIYRWKDDAGKTHFTNNPALVPLKKDAHIIKMKALPTPAPEEVPIDGQSLWRSNCISCHHIEVESFKGMQGMPQLIGAIKDSDSSPERRLGVLRAAIKGDMDNNIKSLKGLSEGELQAIITYIADQVAVTAPPTVDPLKK